MTRRTVVSLVAALAVIAPFLLNDPVLASHADSPPAATHVCGTLSSNTTWAAANSPYQMDCGVTVPSGVTLTIEPGVVVNATGTLKVQGVLKADGTETSRISFTANSWGGINFASGASANSSVSFADITGADTGLHNYPAAELDDASFFRGTTGMSYDSSHTITLQNDYFQDNAQAGFVGSGNVAMINDGFDESQGSSTTTAVQFSGGDLEMSGVVIQSAGPGVVSTGGTLSLADSVAAGGTTAVRAGSGVTALITTTILENAQTGLEFDGGASLSVTSSDVVGNQTGLLLSVTSNNVKINNDNIYNNTKNIGQQAAGGGSDTVDATNNWWNSTDLATIRATIADCQSNSALACVNVQPFLTAPDPSAPSLSPSTTTPTATATGAAQPTPTATTATGTAISITATPTGTPTSTGVAAPTATSTATPTATTSVRAPSITIDKVEILQTVKGREQNTRTVRFGKKARFIVLYHVANAPSAIPSGTLSITKNGKSLHTYKLYPFTLNGHAGLRKGITFSNKKDAGGLFAHFRLTLGAASAKRDRKFSLK